MINSCKAFLRKNRAEWQLPTGGEWNFLFFNNAHPHITNLDLLWFHNDSEFPSVVTKLCRDEQMIRREFDNLSSAYSSAPTWIPKPLACRPFGEYWGLWMKGIDGFPLSPKEYRGSTLNSAVETLGAVHRSMTAAAAPVAADRRRRQVSEPLDSIIRFGDDRGVGAFFERLKTNVGDEWIAKLPAVPQHGDFFSGNLLRSADQRWSLLDWESFGAIDLPYYDLLTFLLALLWEQGPGPAAWGSSLVREIPDAVERYSRSAGVPAADLSVLLPLTLANWFHLHLVDGRRPFSERMYTRIQRYVEAPELWEKVFRVSN